MKTNPQKLTLNQETLRNLTSEETTQVVGFILTRPECAPPVTDTCL